MNQLADAVVKKVAKAGLQSGAVVVGGALLGPVGVVSGAMMGAATEAAVNNHQNSSSFVNVGLCRAIDDVKRTAVEKLPASQAMPLVQRLDTLAGIVGCSQKESRPNRLQRFL